MCYPLPGPRCSPHARTKLEGLIKRRDEKQEQLVKVARERATLRSELREKPESKRLQQKLVTVTKRGAALKTQISSLSEKARLAQIDYDGTPDGQRELKESLGKAKTYQERNAIIKRISRGKAKNFSRRHMMEQVKLNKETGMSTRRRRGDFIRFADRDGSEPIEHDQDLLSAA